MEGEAMDLDNLSVIKQRDAQDALGVAASEWAQLRHELTLEGEVLRHDFDNIVVTGMGGSALAAGMAKDWLDLQLPFEVVRGYRVPKYVGQRTLVVASSYSGNTEETISALKDAHERGAVTVVIANGGALIDHAKRSSYPFVQLTAGMQPRMAVFANLVALITIFQTYGVVQNVTRELRAAADTLEQSSNAWLATSPTHENVAKQLAQELLGKTPVIYASNLMRSVAYKWKISFNENAKNVAFWNELPEFNHNEFMGWTSHPIQKPYGIIDLRSAHDHPQIAKRFDVSDRLLSGKRPKATEVTLGGESILEQMLWGFVLADFVSIYLAILNGVDPTPVDLIEKLKKELA